MMLLVFSNKAFFSFNTYISKSNRLDQYYFMPVCTKAIWQANESQARHGFAKQIWLVDPEQLSNIKFTYVTRSKTVR